SSSLVSSFTYFFFFFFMLLPTPRSTLFPTRRSSDLGFLLPPLSIRMAKLVFDIETSALPLENFDEVQQEYLFREAERLADEPARDRKSTRLNSSHVSISYAVFCLKKKRQRRKSKYCA